MNTIVTIVISTINHSDIGVMCTNLANELGHHLVGLVPVFIQMVIQVHVGHPTSPWAWRLRRSFFNPAG